MEVDLSPSLGEVAASIKSVSVKAKIRLSLIGEEVPCKVGCNHCCSRLIYISMAEAIIIRNYLVKNGLWADVEKRAKDLQDFAMKLDSVTWFTMNLKCPIMNPNTGKCEAYEVRPPACSVHFVLSDPSSCDPWSTEKMSYAQFDMIDLFEDFAKSLQRTCGDNMMIPLPIPIALLTAERMSVKSGLTLDEVISTIAKNT